MYKQEKRYYQKAFFYAVLMACVLLLPFVIIDGGYFVYYGDFNAQQIPFYKTCIRAVQSGSFGWNWQTDLGANFVGSYSFYTLGSPFFWFAALFPVSISHYLMAPLLVLKLGLASLFAFVYIRRFVRKPDSALIGGILYAFSGYSLYNIFFNHFHEAIVFFPLLLIALEEAVVNRRRGVFALAVALNAFVNYFFFIGECVFLVIYFVVRLCCDKRFRVSLGGFMCLAFESVIGVAIAGILFVPSIFQVLDVPRAGNILTDGSFLFYTKVQRYGLILESMFFPPEIPARSYMFPEADAKWASVALYLPLFSMAGVTAFVKHKGKHWISVLSVVCLAAAFVPGLNASFTMLNTSFYTRWFYMAELIICLATVCALERCSQRELKFGLSLCAVTAGLMALLVLLHPVKYTVGEGEAAEEKMSLNFLHGVNINVYIQTAISAAFLILLGVLIRKRARVGDIAKQALSMTVVCCMILGYYFVAHGRIIGPYIGSYNKSVEADIHIDDAEFYRIEAFGEENNVNMLWNMSSLRSFTSILPNSTFEMYKLVGYNRTVNSAPENKYYALRSMMGVKYYIVPRSADSKKAHEALDALEVYEPYTTCGDYDIYINEYAFPMGYAYDSYVPYETAEKQKGADRLMCRAVVLTEEQIEKYSDILTELPKSDISKVSLDRFEYDAKQRIAAGVSEFTITKNGFSARTDYEADELVVFSVPFDKGWSARVNGTPAEVEKVNGGLCAVRVPAGEHYITFEYTTPGAKEGIMLTTGGAALYALYMLIQYVILRRKPRRYVHLYDMDIGEGVKAHSSYINQLTRQISQCPEKGRIYRADVNKAEYEAISRHLSESDSAEEREILDSIRQNKDNGKGV